MQLAIMPRTTLEKKKGKNTDLMYPMLPVLQIIIL